MKIALDNNYTKIRLWYNYNTDVREPKKLRFFIYERILTKQKDKHNNPSSSKRILKSDEVVTEYGIMKWLQNMVLSINRCFENKVYTSIYKRFH